MLWSYPYVLSRLFGGRETQRGLKSGRLSASKKTAWTFSAGNPGAETGVLTSASGDGPNLFKKDEAEGDGP